MVYEPTQYSEANLLLAVLEGDFDGAEELAREMTLMDKLRVRDAGVDMVRLLVYLIQEEAA